MLYTFKIIEEKNDAQDYSMGDTAAYYHIAA